MKNISERLEYAIRRSGKTKSALAAYIKVPGSSVSRWLAGSEPRADKLSEIAKFLSVDVKWLMTGESIPSSASNAESEGKAKDSGAVREDPAPYGDERMRISDLERQLAASRETIDSLSVSLANVSASLTELHKLLADKLRQP